MKKPKFPPMIATPYSAEAKPNKVKPLPEMGERMLKSLGLALRRRGHRQTLRRAHHAALPTVAARRLRLPFSGGMVAIQRKPE